jgi:hypothetical protein
MKGVMTQRILSISEVEILNDALYSTLFLTVEAISMGNTPTCVQLRSPIDRYSTYCTVHSNYREGNPASELISLRIGIFTLPNNLHG